MEELAVAMLMLQPAGSVHSWFSCPHVELTNLTERSVTCDVTSSSSIKEWNSIVQMNHQPEWASQD